MGECTNSIVVSAPVDKVWATVRDFHDMSFAPEIIESVTTVGSLRGDEPGAKRVLNGAFHETMTSVRTIRDLLKTMDARSMTQMAME